MNFMPNDSEDKKDTNEIQSQEAAVVEQDKPDFNTKFSLLQKQYTVRLQKSVGVLNGYIQTLEQEGVSRKLLVDTRDFVHGLAGSGAVFGFPAVSEKAKNLEDFVSEILLGALVIESFKDEEKNKLLDLIQILKNECEKKEGDQTSDHQLLNVDLGDEAPVYSVVPFVLIIDDDRNICELLSHHLNARNIKVAVAYNGEEGLMLLQKERPDLILLDICMPTISGHEVMKAIANHPAYRSIPVLMLSAKKDEGNIIRALKDRAIGYVIKPFDAKKLVLRIEKTLQEKFKKNRILIVDNDDFILKYLEDKFKAKGFQVDLAKNGHLGLNAVLKERPDLVILDMIMPKMTGMEFIKRLRTNISAEELPILVLSTESGSALVKAAMQEGAQFYINKPFVFDQLFQASLRLMKKS